MFLLLFVLCTLAGSIRGEETLSNDITADFAARVGARVGAPGLPVAAPNFNVLPSGSVVAVGPASNASASSNASDSASDSASRQYGSGKVPFTMSQVISSYVDFSQQGDPVVTVNLPGELTPWSATGLIEHTSGPRQGEKCSAALIGPNIAVTAASCFCDYGGPVEFGAAKFSSAKADSVVYFEAQVANVFPSSPYCGGTDTCVTSGSLRKCANNLAVVSLLNINAPAELATLAPGSVARYYTIKEYPYSFTSGLTGTWSRAVTRSLACALARAHRPAGTLAHPPLQVLRPRKLPRWDILPI